MHQRHSSHFFASGCFALSTDVSCLTDTSSLYLFDIKVHSRFNKNGVTGSRKHSVLFVICHFVGPEIKVNRQTRPRHCTHAHGQKLVSSVTSFIVWPPLSHPLIVRKETRNEIKVTINARLNFLFVSSICFQSCTKCHNINFQWK